MRSYCCRSIRYCEHLWDEIAYLFCCSQGSSVHGSNIASILDRSSWLAGTLQARTVWIQLSLATIVARILFILGERETGLCQLRGEACLRNCGPLSRRNAHS